MSSTNSSVIVGITTRHLRSTRQHLVLLQEVKGFGVNKRGGLWKGKKQQIIRQRSVRRYICTATFCDDKAL